MPKTKISEFSATAGNNTDIDGINIAEGCAPSGINDAIRELMAQLKDFQAGTAGDSFNGPVGTTTAAAGAFTTLSASSTVSGTGFSNYLASPPAIGATTPNTGSFTTLTTSSTVTHNGGTANGVAYLNGSKVLTTGSALTFDGSNLTVSNAGAQGFEVRPNSGDYSGGINLFSYNRSTSAWSPMGSFASYFAWQVNGSEQMRLTSTGLGIGTSSPATKLDTAGTMRSTGNTTPSSGAGLELLYDSGNTRGIVQVYDRTGSAYRQLALDGSSILMRIAGTTQATLESSGNLGLGVTPSAWLSSYRAIDIQNYGAIASRSATNSLEILTNAYRNSAANYIYKNNGTAQYIEAANGAYAFYTAGSGTAGNAISFTQAMTLDANGNLGVGQTSMASDTRLHLNNTANNTLVKIQSTFGAELQLINGGGSELSIINASGNNVLVFRTGGTERARITSGGSFFVGFTSGPSAAGNFYSTSTAVIAAIDGNAASADILFAGYSDSTSTALGTLRFQIAANGNVTNSNGSYGTISDAKMKTDIVDAGSQWADIKAIRFRKFKMKDDPDQIVQLGVVAQELEQTSPGLVDEHIDRDGDGNDLGTTTKSVKTSVLLMKAAVALQEAMARIEQLEAKVAALEAK